eukprot:scpid55167/ scgid13700/ 
MRISLGRFLSLCFCQRLGIQFFHQRNFQRGRLILSILVIQLVAASWLVYRLKQPHKRVRSLIKHPYHLFNKDQFKQRPEERQCSPDSQEQEESIFAAVTGESVERNKATICTFCPRSGLGQNISFWRSRLLEHNTFQQAECEPGNVYNAYDGRQQQATILVLNVAARDHVEALRVALSAFVVAVLARKAFVVEGPGIIANEYLLTHRHLDWRPVASACGQMISEDDSQSVVQVNTMDNCTKLAALLGMNISKAQVKQANLKAVGLECLAMLLESTVLHEPATQPLVHAIAAASFRSVFDLPAVVRRAVKDFLHLTGAGRHRRQRSSHQPVAAVNASVQALSSDVAATSITSVSHSHEQHTSAAAAGAVVRPTMGSAVDSTILVTPICIEVESDMVETDNLWRCARLLERVLAKAKSKEAGQHFDWILVGENKTRVLHSLDDAAKYQHCTGRADRGFKVERSVRAWMSPLPEQSHHEWMGRAYLLSQCAGHVGHSHSNLSQFASLMAGRQYMSVLPGTTQAKPDKTKQQLGDICKLQLAM